MYPQHGMTKVRSYRRIRHSLRQFLCTALFCAAGAAPAMATPLELLTYAPPVTQEYHAGKVVLTELVTPDLAAAEQFYSGLFGWTFRDIQSGRTEYTGAFLNDHLVADLIQKPVPAGEHRQPAWLTFISAPDVDAAKDIAVKNGAKLLFGPRNITDRGREAVLADPQGAVFALLASSSGDSSDVLAGPGEWIWSSLITRDPDTDAAFYQKLFNYEVFDLSSDNKAGHLLLASGNYARGSVNVLPTKNIHSHPHWLNFVHVENTDEAAAKVIALGGHVLVKPRVDRHGGIVAVVTDPQGAPFGLMEWPDTESEKVSK